MKTLGKQEINQNIFFIINFNDMNYSHCTLQNSRYFFNKKIGTYSLYLGRKFSEMHLNREQVESLIFHLQNWLNSKDGSFIKEENE